VNAATPGYEYALLSIQQNYFESDGEVGDSYFLNLAPPGAYASDIGRPRRPPRYEVVGLDAVGADDEPKALHQLKNAALLRRICRMDSMRLTNTE
jgi:hypothetical protein